MTDLEIMQILIKARELGITQGDVDQYKKNVSRETKELKAEEIVKPASYFDEPTEEELLYWSTPYYDQLQEKKQAMIEAKKNGGDI